jgi:hypothetical protein
MAKGVNLSFLTGPAPMSPASSIGLSAECIDPHVEIERAYSSS